jgi:hypothetical protein
MGVPVLQHESQHGKPLKENMLQECIQQLESSQPAISVTHDHRIHPPRPEKISIEPVKTSRLQDPDFRLF